MERNRFRVPNGRVLQRATTAFDSSEGCDVQAPRRSFTAREPNEREMPPRPPQRPSSRFSAPTSFFIDDAEPSDMHPRASTASYASTLDNDERGPRSSSPKSVPASTDGNIEMLDDFESGEYRTAELHDFIRAWSPRVAQAVVGLTDLMATASRYAEPLEDSWEGTKEVLLRQDSAIMREREMTVGLKADLQEMKSSLEDVRSAEKDANSRLADMVGRMGVSSSENERLRGDVKALEGTLAAERIENENTRGTLEIEAQSLAAKVDSQNGLLAQKDEKVHEIKQELSYVQRRIEDDIATRKKITIERDEFCCQVAELQDAFKLERCKLESAAEQGKKSKAQAVQLRRTSEEQFEKERVLVEQLRLDNKSKIDDITHMKKLFDDLSLRSTTLDKDMLAVEETTREVEAFLLQFSEAVAACRDSQVFEVPNLGLTVGDDVYRPTIADREEESDENLGEGTQPSSVPGEFRFFSQKLKQALVETACREVTLTAYFANSKTALQDLRKSQLQANETHDETRAAVRVVTEELSIACKELDALKSILARADEERTGYHRKFCESVKRLDAGKQVVQNELQTCRSDLQQAKVDNAVLQDGIIGREATIRELKDVLSVTEDANIKALEELGGCRRILQESRTQLQTLGRSSESEIKDIRELVRSETVAKEQALNDLENCKGQLGCAKTELAERTQLADRERDAAKLEFARVMKEKADEAKERVALQHSLSVCVTERDTAIAKLEECRSEVQVTEGKLARELDKTTEMTEGIENARSLRTDASTLAKQPKDEARCDVLQTDKLQSPRIGKALGNQAKNSNPTPANCLRSTSALPKKRQQGKAPPKATKPKRTKVKASRNVGLRRQDSRSNPPKSVQKPGDKESQLSNGDDDEDWFFRMEGDS